MSDTLGLLEEARQIATDLGYEVREEPLGDLAGGPCVIAGRRAILDNLEQSAAERLAVLLRTLGSDPAARSRPVSRAASS
ncbi:MAG: hypothetical protein ACKON8_08520, partial [Planctomycetota bacterium]